VVINNLDSLIDIRIWVFNNPVEMYTIRKPSENFLKLMGALAPEGR
jgi:hypothetical protein